MVPYLEAATVTEATISTRYAYHHDCSDNHERIIRGFGQVERWEVNALHAESMEEAFDATSVETVP